MIHKRYSISCYILHADYEMNLKIYVFVQKECFSFLIFSSLISIPFSMINF